MHTTWAQPVSFPARARMQVVVLLFGGLCLAPWFPVVCQQPSSAEQPLAGHAGSEDHARKEKILGGARWRRAQFEFNEWLVGQTIYTSDEVQRMRAGLAGRVAEMSSYELEYLLDSLDEKMRILDSPEAREAREWLGGYLSVMTDAKRAAALGKLPDILSMTAAELEDGIRQVEKKRADVARQRSASLRTQDAYRHRIEAGHRATATEKARRSALRPGVPFSPYRGQAPASPPFPAAEEGAAFLGIGPWGMAVSIDIGMF